jgi:hypothetical protein
MEVHSVSNTHGTVYGQSGVVLKLFPPSSLLSHASHYFSYTPQACDRPDQLANNHNLGINSEWNQINGAVLL